jgi:hypothetical protein
MSARNVRTTLLLASATLFTGLIAGSYAITTTGLSPFTTSQVAAQPSVTAGVASDQVSFAEGFSPVVKRTLASVVNIASSKVVRVPQGPLVPFLSDPRDHLENAIAFDMTKVFTSVGLSAASPRLFRNSVKVAKSRLATVTAKHYAIARIRCQKDITLRRAATQQRPRVGAVIGLFDRFRVSSRKS